MATMTILWLVLAIVMTVLEAATVQLVSIWFVIGAVAACITSLVSDSMLIQVIVFVAVTAAALIITRPMAKRLKSKQAEATNADRYIGQEGLVVTDIRNAEAIGQVRVGTSTWSARSESGEDIPAGTQVVISSIEGVKLIVKIK